MVRVSFVLVMGVLLGACLRTPAFRCDEDPSSCPDGGPPVIGDGRPPDGNPSPDGGPSRAHSVCSRGSRLDRAGNACVSAVCDRMPSCCTGSWTALCIQLAEIEEKACAATCSELIAFSRLSEVMVYEHSGDTWKPAGSHAVASDKYQALSFADVDNDGLTELAVGAQTNTQLVLDHRGTKLDKRIDLTATLQLTNFEVLETSWGDLDGDGKLELGLFGTNAPYALGLAYPVDGPLKVEPETNLDDIGHSGDAADYDGDGDDDFAVLLYNTKKIVVLSQVVTTGDKPVLKVAQTVPLVSGQFGSSPMRLAWGDADRDGDPDLLVVGYGFIQVYRNLTENGVDDKPGTFAAAPIFDVQLETERMGDGAWIDYDRDGDFDIVTVPVHFGGGPLRLYLNDGTGKFQRATWPSTDPPQFAFSIAVGDVNGDHYPDLVVANMHDGDGARSQASVWINTHGGTQKFDLVWSLPIDEDITYVDIGDRP